mgnify:CR=1 FL=1
MPGKLAHPLSVEAQQCCVCTDGGLVVVHVVTPCHYPLASIRKERYSDPGLIRRLRCDPGVFCRRWDTMRGGCRGSGAVFASSIFCRVSSLSCFFASTAACAFLLLRTCTRTVRTHMQLSVKEQVHCFLVIHTAVCQPCRDTQQFLGALAQQPSLEPCVRSERKQRRSHTYTKRRSKRDRPYPVDVKACPALA